MSSTSSSLRFKTCSWQKPPAPSSIPKLWPSRTLPEPPYKIPCPPSSGSPPRPRPSRPQAAPITRRRRHIRRRSLSIPAKVVHPEPSSLFPHIRVELVHLRDVVSWSFVQPNEHYRSSPPRRPLRRRIGDAPRPPNLPRQRLRLPHYVAHTRVNHPAPKFLPRCAPAKRRHHHAVFR